jgi:hypothetical protein
MAAAALFAAASATFTGPVIAIAIAVIGLVVGFAPVLLGVVRQRRAGQKPEWGGSFGDASMHRATAWRSGLAGTVLAAVSAAYIEPETAILFAAATGALVLSSVVLASHSD